MLLHKRNGLLGAAAGLDEPPENVAVDVVGAGTWLAWWYCSECFADVVNAALGLLGVGAGRRLVLVIRLRRQHRLDVRYGVVGATA